MRKFIIAATLAACAASSQAKDTWYASTVTGGNIILTDSKCGKSQSYFYYVTDTNGEPVNTGCYAVSAPWVYAVDLNEKTHKYAIGAFTAISS
jgi:hypothetical protein